MDQHTPPTLAEVQGTLDELAAAARAGEADRYRAPRCAWPERQGQSPRSRSATPTDGAAATTERPRSTTRATTCCGENRPRNIARPTRQH